MGARFEEKAGVAPCSAPGTIPVGHSTCSLLPCSCFAELLQKITVFEETKSKWWREI